MPLLPRPTSEIIIITERDLLAHRNVASGEAGDFPRLDVAVWDVGLGTQEWLRHESSTKMPWPLGLGRSKEFLARVWVRRVNCWSSVDVGVHLVLAVEALDQTTYGHERPVTHLDTLGILMQI
ncbi:hypothetical protein VC83_06743 [Pseudogymnoascus destructans]|uniref:Uncharacterized protein n=1 Tax=Pseudogymnoascus destructans TaxID=655981 RepID=A0A177A281_9PEZI|nr:uncharacterized protein VC83_06743 [Pseudogymnoascus destructans]OAF56375.1 hypothetical protein VC83_06743 [Pseudogymnoascus destructans]